MIINNTFNSSNALGTNVKETKITTLPPVQKHNLVKPIKPFLGIGRMRIFQIYFTHPSSGKRTKKSTGTTVYTKAKIELEKFMRVQSSTVIMRNLSKDPKLNDLLNLILSVSSSLKSTNTISLYKLAFANFIRIIGNKSIILVNRFDADFFINKLLEKLEKTSINIYLRTLRSAFNMAVSYGIAVENPFKNIKELVVPDKIRPNITDDELKKWFEAADNELIRRIVKFDLQTAMRLSEIVNLQWKDIDFNNKKIMIRNKISFSTKTRKDREISLTDNIFRLISGEVSSNTDNVLQTRNEDDYVFGKDNGFRFSPEYISHLFKKYAIKANLNKKICFHSIRHSALTKMATSGIPLYILKEIAGHSSISTTQKYLHSDIFRMGQFMERINYGI